jgi:hypothetical protein
MDIWGLAKTLDSGKGYRAQIGPLVLWFRRNSDEIHIAAERTDSETFESGAISFSAADDSPTKMLDWKRWVTGEKSDTISILPVMPDRPVVVRPEVPVKIPQGREALFFVSIPVWVKIVVIDTEEVVLCQEPSIKLSNIWFGSHISGELCYSLRTTARREIVDTVSKPHRAVCPVRILNTTKSQLDIDRFCVDAGYMDIYNGTKRLWTNEVHISFKGEDDANEIEYIETPPDFEDVGEIVSKAKIKLKKTLLKRSLGTFRLLTGF